MPLWSATVGERIALHRRRRGLDQAQLARLLGRSPYWLSQVERGLRSIDRASVLAHVATVLRVSVGELAPESVLTEERDRESKLAGEVRAALTAYPSLAAVPPPGTPDSLLRAEVDEAWELLAAAAQEELVGLLPALLARADVARSCSASPGSQRPRLVAETYQVTAGLLGQLGESDLALVAADRALSAAHPAADRLLRAGSVFRLAHALLSAFRSDQAQQVALDTVAALEAELPDEPAAVALAGALHLVAALAATQRLDRDTTLECLRAAETAAARVGPGRDDEHTGFGPENVLLHAVTIAVEFGNPAGALERAAQVDPSSLSPERRARLLLDVARAHDQSGDARAALEALAEAEAVAPELIRTHDLVRGLLRELLATGDADARAYARAWESSAADDG